MKTITKTNPVPVERRAFEGSLAEVLEDFEERDFKSFEEMQQYMYDIADWFGIKLGPKKTFKPILKPKKVKEKARKLKLVTSAVKTGKIK